MVHWLIGWPTYPIKLHWYTSTSLVLMTQPPVGHSLTFISPHPSFTSFNLILLFYLSLSISLSRELHHSCSRIDDQSHWCTSTCYCLSMSSKRLLLISNLDSTYFFLFFYTTKLIFGEFLLRTKAYFKCWEMEFVSWIYESVSYLVINSLVSIMVTMISSGLHHHLSLSLILRLFESGY